MDNNEREQLQRKMKRAKREAEELQEQMTKAPTDAAKRAISNDIDDLERKARQLKRKLR